MKNKDVKIIGERIHELRAESGLSQSKLGEMLSVSHHAISLWENSKSCPPGNIVVLLSEIFQVSCDYILGVTEY